MQSSVGPKWHRFDELSNKNGLHSTVYCVNGDRYLGDYKDNKRSGKGKYVSKTGNMVYEGDWKNNKRHGFGNLSTFDKSLGRMRKAYAGGWKCGMRHGFGTHYYANGEYYEGEWKSNQRSGWGVMFYADNSRYEGQWSDDKRSGTGVLILDNGNMYEGMWKNDLKNGEGQYHYRSKGQLFKGTYLDGIPKCGTFEDYDRESAENATKFSLPALGLRDPDLLLKN